MTSQRKFEYYVVKYVPNAAGGTDFNIGVLLVEQTARLNERSDLSFPLVRVRFLKDWTTLERLVGDVDLEVVSAIVSEINFRCEGATTKLGALPLRELLRELASASNGVVLGPPKGLVTADPELVLDELATRYL